MMKIVLIAVGKTDKQWVSDGIADYTGRLSHFAPFQMIVVNDIRNTRNIDAKVQKELEGEAIMRQLSSGDDVVLLDDKGSEMSSEGLALWLGKRMAASPKRLVFIIGGPYGFSEKVYAAASAKLSLSRLTFTHQMVRVVFAEQLYRAFTILKGIPYHHS